MKKDKFIPTHRIAYDVGVWIRVKKEGEYFVDRFGNKYSQYVLLKEIKQKKKEKKKENKIKVEIEKGIPIPEKFKQEKKKPKNFGNTVYPFSKMEEGDSFLFPLLIKIRSCRVYVSRANLFYKDDGFHFSVYETKVNGKKRIRCHRVK